MKEIYDILCCNLRTWRAVLLLHQIYLYFAYIASANLPKPLKSIEDHKMVSQNMVLHQYNNNDQINISDENVSKRRPFYLLLGGPHCCCLSQSVNVSATDNLNV